MTWFVGTIAAAVLLALSALHVYWALGGLRGVEVTIPKRDGRPLFSPGSAQTLIVAGLLSAGAFVLLGRLRLWGSWLPRWLFEAGSWTLAIVFGARVVGDFRWFGLWLLKTPNVLKRITDLSRSAVVSPVCTHLLSELSS